MPNILYILADDLGYGELGVYGQKYIETPNLDKLARQGMKFTRHYSGSPVCAPSRCVLLTGKHTGHAHIRGNDEWRERGEVWDFAKAVEDPNLEGKDLFRQGTATLGSVLQSVGYKTAIVGKWGLGAPLTESIPTKKALIISMGTIAKDRHIPCFPNIYGKMKKKFGWTTNWCLLEPNSHLMQIRLTKRAMRITHSMNMPQRLCWKRRLVSWKQSTRTLLPVFCLSPSACSLTSTSKVDRSLQGKIGIEPPYTGKKGYFPCRYPKATYAAMISYLTNK